MGTWEKIRAALKREKRELDDIVGDAKTRANATLDQRERELKATPEEKLKMEQERGAQIDDDFDAVRRRIEGGGSSK